MLDMYKNPLTCCDIKLNKNFLFDTQQQETNADSPRFLITDRYIKTSKYLGAVYIIQNNNRRILRCLRYIDRPTLIICIENEKFISKVWRQIQKIKAKDNIKVLYENSADYPNLAQHIKHFINQITY